MHIRLKSAAPVLAVVASAVVPVFVAGCGNRSEEPYKPVPAWSGRKASLPSVPQLPTAPMKVGDAYSVFGAVHQLRSRFHSEEVTAKEISIVGYIAESNILTAPACAQHPTGKADPEGCETEIPSFWISDTKPDLPVGGDKGRDAAAVAKKSDPTKPMDPKELKIRVLGWASNFANVYEAMHKYQNLKEPPKELYKDEFTNVDVPFPLPAVGAKVRITGKYGMTFSKGTGVVSDPVHGLISYTKMEVLEPAPEPAAFAKK